jgi:PH (Pleckstrin Homology) domain-containing protein
MTAAVLAARPVWAIVLQWTLWLALMTLVMRWVGRTREDPAGTQARGTLAHPRSTLVIGLVCTAFFLACAVGSVVLPGRTRPPAWLPFFFLAFAALGVPMILDWRNARHTLVPGGLRYHTMLGRAGDLRWTEVRKLSYSSSSKWFRLDLADGRVVRISAMLVGLPEFAAAALAEVPAAAIDPGTRTVLAATAAGELPKVWG